MKKSSEDVGRIAFSHERGAYVVMYRKADGSRTSTSKGLRVHTHTPTGIVLNASEYKQEIRKVKEAAMKLWNALDVSSASQYDIA